MRRKRSDRAELLEMRATAEFERKLARVSTAQEAQELALTPMAQQAPGYRRYRDLAYFLRFGTPPDGASDAEVEQLVALDERLRRVAADWRATLRWKD
jgi:alpha-D-ribose 1-methylphosphonate 5-triphosphate diphosphatase PhnM